MESWPTAWPQVGPADKLHIFDPDGDILLQIGGEVQIIAPVTDGLLSVLDASLLEEEPVVVEETSQFEPLQYEDSSDLQPPTEVQKDDACDLRAPRSEQRDRPEFQSPPAVYLRVSSKHLILTSAMFKIMLSPDKFSEGRSLQSGGNLVVPLEDDLDSLVILMNIIHGMTRKVPRTVTLDTLAKLAHLVSYYQLEEVVELFSDTWITNLKQKGFPASYSREVIPWLFISWVFKKGAEFEKLTCILEYGSDGKLQEDIDNTNKNFLIPDLVVCSIEENRCKAIASIIRAVHDHITRYLTPGIHCSNKSFDCDSIVLGSLLKSATTIGIWPHPEVPYPGITFRNLAFQVRGMAVLDDCQQQGSSSSWGPSHGVKDAIEASVDSLEDQLRGLKLDLSLPRAQIRNEKNNPKLDRKKKKGKQKSGKSILWLDEDQSMDRLTE